MSARVTLFAGHYGSGKTNLSFSYARRLKAETGGRVAVADLDIVNPYFRTKDFAPVLEKEGIELVVSDFANTNVDFPALPGKAYSLFDDTGVSVVVDVGGDDRGALALGRFSDDIRSRGDYEMVAVINASRPLTATVSDTVEVLREIEQASSLPFTSVANNTNLGPSTDENVVLGSLSYAEQVCRAMSLPLSMTVCPRSLERKLEGLVPALFPVDIAPLYYHLNG